MTVTWNDVSVSIRTVRGARDGIARDLLDRVNTFAPHAVLAVHQHGRSVPESYADALSIDVSMASFKWVLQLEDDAILAPDFELHALELIRLAESQQNVALVSFYSGRRVKSDDGLLSPGGWEVLPGSKFLMAQALALRSSLVEDHNAFMLEFTRSRPYATDTATAGWMKARKLRYMRAWPSIVQHRDVPSLSGHRANPNRFSESFRRVYE